MTPPDLPGNAQSTGQALVLVHLSDIHLTEAEIAGSQDLDLDIREKLIADLRDSELPLKLGVAAVLVTGDTAFAGKTKEYESAHEWLRRLCGELKCPTSHVWVVPGNHDASQDVMTRAILDMHEVIRDKNQADRLRERLSDSAAANTLLEPFAHFNHFAQQYGGRTEPGRVDWESNELELNDGSVLRLRGLNSALVSDKRDKAIGKPCQVLGQKQVQLRDDDDGVAYMTLSHHPPSWLYDQGAAEDHLNSRARIQLYGHEHRLRAHKIDNSLVVCAGALHPDRGEDGWEPRYNVMTVVVENGPPRELIVDLFARVWKPADTRFGADIGASGKYPERYTLSLRPWQRPPAHRAAPTVPHTTAMKPNPPPPVVPPLPTRRDIVYDFFDLSYPDGIRLLLELNLMQSTDEGISEAELISRAYDRAKQAGQLDQLAKAIRKALAKK